MKEKSMRKHIMTMMIVMASLLFLPALAPAAIVQDGDEAWRATAMVENGELFVAVDPAGAADWVCPWEGYDFTVVAGDLYRGDIGHCDMVEAPTRFRVTGDFDPMKVTAVIWNRQRLVVRR
jgi:hypothetical protein